MNQNFTYIDAIDNIVMIEGIVRFATITLSRGTADKPQGVRTGGLALSLPAFLRMYEQMGRVVNNMAEQGMIKRKDAPAAAVAAPEVPAEPAEASPATGKGSRKR